MKLFYRLIAYIAVFVFYLAFMDLNAPMGITWLDWHAHRIFNAVEFLKVNGYFYYYGYSATSRLAAGPSLRWAMDNNLGPQRQYRCGRGHDRGLGASGRRAT